MKIIQIVESLAIGDAVANDAVAIDKLIKKKGVCGGIYVTNASNIADRYLHTIAEPIQNIPDLDKKDVLLFHHAICNPFCDSLREIRCHKIMIYHNITPPHFFENIDKGLMDATQLGLEQTEELNDVFECCIADSEFNRQNLIDMGYTCPIYVCPVLVPFREYDQLPNRAIINKYKNDGWVNVLFVGRLSPQKKQQDIMKAFALYKKYYNKKSRLFLVGSDGLISYAEMLRNYAAKLNIPDIYITGSIPFTDILAYYLIADVFLCMSEHEGFCVPLLEAMYFDVPIVAYRSTAVTETLGSVGILLDERTPSLAAGWIDLISKDNILKKQLQDEQWDYLQRFSYEEVSKQMVQLLNPYFPKSIGNQNEKDFTIVRPDKTENFVVVIPIKASDWETAKRTVYYIQKNINPKQVIIVSSGELLEVFPENDYITCIDEDKLLPQMTLNNVRRTLRRANGNPQVAGWYLQQFLKLGYSKVTKDDYYLVWDADTIPLTKICFFDEETGKPYFNLKREYVPEYFATIKRLFGFGKARNESYITEHMMFDTKLCKKMLDEIEKNASLFGNTFWEKCIYASNYRKSERAFSEYETFGTYIAWKHPEAYKVRTLRTLRSGQTFLGKEPSDEILNWAGKDFDTVSFEHFDTIPENNYVKLIRGSGLIRKKISCANIIKKACSKAQKKAKNEKKDSVEYYRELSLRMDFDFFFGDETVFERKNL